jgi:catechol 2,3-dioxygenase
MATPRGRDAIIDGMAATPDPNAAARGLPPGTSLGPVRLNAGDAPALADFYERTVGLRALQQPDGIARMGVGAGRPLVELVPAPDAPRRPAGTTGLFHLAILVPSRLELARALRRVPESGWRLTGASDHLVSEALYLRDPEGNGIEIYRDRPRAQWRHAGGEIQMDTLPLDLEGVLAELAGDDSPPAELPAETRIGHVHLNVASLRAAEAFYREALGFDVTVRGYPGALFVSAGGYHHHLGLNTWLGEGAPAPPPGARGLERFEIVVPDAAALDATAARLASHGVQADRSGEALTALDPSGNRVLVSAPRGD